jgi:hypothetical protein
VKHSSPLRLPADLASEHPLANYAVWTFLRTSLGDMPCSMSYVSLYFRMLERCYEIGQPSTARHMRVNGLAGGNARVETISNTMNPSRRFSSIISPRL